MEKKFQILLDKILRQIFIKKVADSAEAGVEEESTKQLVQQKEPVAVVAFIVPAKGFQRRSPEYYQSFEYFANFRQKLRVCFKQEREVIQSSEPGESFEKRMRLGEIDSLVEEIALLEYEDLPLLSKIARLEEIQEIYRKMVKNRQTGA